MKDSHELFLNKGFNSVYRNSAAVLDTRNTLSFTISVTSLPLCTSQCAKRLIIAAAVVLSVLLLRTEGCMSLMLSDYLFIRCF